VHSSTVARGRATTLERAASEDRKPVFIVRPVLSFDQVYEQHFRFVWRVLRAFGLPPSMVEDAAQDVFVVVHRRLPEFEGRSDIRTWLYRIAAWVVTGERRRLRRKPTPDPITDEEITDKADGPFESAAKNEAMRTLERVLAKMDTDKRIAFLLIDVEEMKAHEVGELLGLNVNTVSSRLRLAREQFRRLVAEESGDDDENLESAEPAEVDP
jgi:RNA polymerase sigma-70 factor (ECF subfamily)